MIEKDNFWMLLILLTAALSAVAQEAVTQDKAPPAPVPDSGWTVFGTVLDLDEKPINDAEVVLASAPSAAEPARLVTDLAGRFELHGMASGAITWRVRARGYREVTVPGLELPPAEHAAGRPIDLGTLLLAPDRPFQGRVTDPGGEAVAGARVAFEILRPPGDFEHREIQESFTGSDGSFALEGLPEGARLDLEISHETHQPRRLAGIRDDRPEPLEIVLEPGLSLAGEVVDEAEAPVADVEVQLVRVEAAGLWDRPVARARATTDEEGRFRFSGLEPGETAVRARAPEGYALPLELDLRAGQAHPEIRIELRRGASLEGRVLDPDGLGVETAAVRIDLERPGIVEPAALDRDGLGADASESFTDGAGRFRLAGLRPGLYRLSALHPDFRTAMQQIELAGDGPTEVELRFREHRDKEALRLTGRVVDVSGSPVAGAAVRGIPLFGDVGTEVVASRADGSFELTAPRAGDYTIEARHPDFAVDRSAVVALGRAPRDMLEIRLVSAGAVTGSILGLQPEDLAGLHVVATSSPGTALDGRVRYDGRYRVDSLGPGTWSIRATAGERHAEGRVQLVRPGDEARLDLRFEAGVRLDGIVTRLGEPQSGLTVTARCRQAYEGGTSTDAGGRFSLRGVPEGPCALSLADAWGTPVGRRRVEVAPGTEVHFELDIAGLAGRVVSADGKRPVVGAVVAVADAETSLTIARAVTDGLGTFDFQGLDRGPWKLRVSKNGFALLEWEVLAESRDEHLLHLHPIRKTVLYVTDLDGGVPAYVRIELHNGGGSVPIREVHQPALDGRIDLGTLPEGLWELLLSGDGFSARTQLQVPSDPLSIILGDRRPVAGD